ncbi:hypothetical protein [Gemmobacter sp.]|uniref:hypothetical protein n=1 Tax=Gemmobacter sp. TaxID=1898957 RepID=UPI002B00387D|nr:hypothetical protein [Gemmobacter sp.]
MPPTLQIPLTVQLGLGVGYLCYLLVYAGHRRGHTALDATFLSFAFGVPALLPITAGIGSVWVNVITGTMFSFALALAWRGAGKHHWTRLMRWLHVHMDDGMTDAWESILTTPKLSTGQVSVHTTDGRVLYLSDRSKFKTAPEEGLLLGVNGSILMVVEKERLPDGTIELREGIIDPAWGSRMTYIPANQIVRVNIRY